jgi:hypothetical protein
MKKWGKVFSKRRRLIYIILAGFVIIASAVPFLNFVVLQKESRGTPSLDKGPKNLSEQKLEEYLLMSQATRYYAGKRYGKAIGAYREMAKKYPEKAPAALYKIANVLELAKYKQSKIISAYREVIEKYPDSEEAGKSLSVLKRYQLGGRKVQQSFYNEIIDKYPDNKIAEKALDGLEETSSDKTLLYQEIIKKYPDKSIAGIALGKMLVGIQKQQGAESIQKLCLEYLVKYPDSKIQIAAYKYMVSYAHQQNNLQPMMDLSYALIKDFTDNRLTEVVTSTLADIQYQKGNYSESLRLRTRMEKRKNEK